jgi:hypothetical protein
MKTTIFQFSTKSLYKTLIYAGLTGILSVQQTMAMPSLAAHDPVTTATPSADKLRVLSYPNRNSLVIMVHLENPKLDNVSIQIYNSRYEVVYQKTIGRQKSFVGKYNMKQLPDDRYTLLVTSPHQTYSKSFSIQTSFTRVVKSQANTTRTGTQEAI